MCLKMRERRSRIAFLLFISIQVLMPISLPSMIVVFMSMFVGMGVGLSLRAFMVLSNLFELSKSLRHDSTQGYQSRIDIKIKLVLQGIMFVSLSMVGVMFALLVEVMMFNVIMRIMFLAWMMVVMVHMMPFFKAQMRV